MSKTITNIMEEIGIKNEHGCRFRLTRRISDTYKIKTVDNSYPKKYSDKNFKLICDLERKRIEAEKLAGNSNNFNKKQSPIQFNRSIGRYTRISY